MNRTTLKFFVFVLFLILCVIGLSIPEVRELASHERISALVSGGGSWSYVWFVVIYAALIVATVPGTVVTLVGASLFSLTEAFFLTLVGAMLGATISFGIARFLARDMIESWLRRDESRQKRFAKVNKMLERFEKDAFIGVVLMRIAYFPFALVNYTAPLTRISLRNYVLGTFLGIVPGSFVFVFLGNTLSEAWRSGSFSALYTWKVPVAVGLFILSLLLPKWLKRIENRLSPDDEQLKS